MGFERGALSGRAEAGAGLGLTGMEERAALLDGSLAIESRPGGGTLIRVSIPLKEGADGEDPGPDR